MQQYIHGKSVYVVEFDTMPELPITGLTNEEKDYESLVRRVCGDNLNGLLGFTTKVHKLTYAQILTKAIEDGIITEPGKYALYKDHTNNRWEVFAVNEPSR